MSDVDLAARIDTFLGHEELATAIAEALSLQRTSAETEFESMISRVDGRCESRGGPLRGRTFGVLLVFAVRISLGLSVACAGDVLS